MKKDQSGFTLVELLIAITIMVIVTAAVCGFIIVGSRSYASGNSDISVQQEAQLALNQMSDVLIDTTRSVNYAAYDDSGTATLGLKDAEFGFEPSGKSLTMYNGVKVVADDGSETTEAGNGNLNYQFYWDKADETLYYSEIGITETSFPLPGENGCVVLAERVTDFSIDLSQVEEKRVVQIAMTFMNGNKEYKTSNNILIRNKVAINDAKISPINKKVELTVTPMEPSVILEPGDEYHFSTPKVSGKNVMDKSVTWSMSPGYAGGSGFIDAANGIIRIASDEPAGLFEVIITTNAADSDGKHATASVFVNVKRVTAVELKKTFDEDSKNDEVHVSVGNKFTVSASVSIKPDEVAHAVCSACNEDITKDYDVEDWVYYGPVTLVESNEKTATFRVDASAKENEKIDIYATSSLSKRKIYDDVEGYLGLTVAKQEDDLTLEGGIKYGEAFKIGIIKKGFNKGGQGHYIVCARIKESQDAPASSDKIMLFGTNGDNAWLTRDFFGLDVQENWYVTFQIIDPGGQFSPGDPNAMRAVEDYLNNCDASGTYEGSLPHTGKIGCVIYSPVIYYNYNGKVTSGQLHLDPMYATKGDRETYFRVDHVANTKWRGEINDFVKFAVYRGEGNDPSGWGDPIYRYRIENYYEGSQQVGGLSFAELQNANNIILRLNNYSLMDAVGSYHIVPYIRYVNTPSADHSYPVYWDNYDQNYGQIQFYAVPENTIHFEVKTGNITVKAYFDNRQFEGLAYFPLPSDSSFTNYFQKKSTSKQTKEWQQVQMFCPFRGNGGEVCSVGFKRITCEYIAKEDTYILEFFYQDNQNREYSSGKFRCDSDGNEWVKISK